MRIIISSILDIEKSASGRLHNFVDQLNDMGHEITVISINDLWKKQKTESTADTREDLFKKIKIYHPIKGNFSPVFQEIASYFTIKKLLDSIDAKNYDLHFNYNSLVVGYNVAKYLKKYAVPTIFDLADDLPSMAGKSPQIHPIFQPFAFWYSKKFLLQNIAVSTKVSVTCQSLADAFIIPPKKVEIIPNGVDFDLFLKTFESRKEKRNNWLKIGYIGVLREWVNFKPLFFALKKFKNHKLFIAGKEGNYDQIQKIIKKEGLASRVKMMGAIPYSKVPQFLSTVDVGVLPFEDNHISKNAYPLKILEYTAAGLPIISSNLPEVRKLMKDSILYANSSDEWVSVIRKITQDYSYYARIIKKQRNEIKNLNWNKLSLKLEKIFKEVSGKE